MQIGKTKVSFHWSALLIPAFLIYHSISIYVDPIKGALTGCIMSVGLLLIVFLHEMAHIKSAELLGNEAPSKISFFALGGLAQFHILDKPSHELITSIAGPASNIVLAAMTLGFSWLIGVDLEVWRPLAMSYADGFYLPMALNMFFWYNVFLGVFNMIPAFPMDGGRVLRAVLSMIMKPATATKIVFAIAMVFAALFVVGGIWIGDVWITILGPFIAFAAKTETDPAFLQKYMPSLWSDVK